MKEAYIKGNRNFESDVPIWYFLKEFSLSEFLSDHDRRDRPKAGYLFQAVWKLGVSPEWVENIEMTLAGFAKEALEHYKHGRLESPGRIRIFCQKKIIDDANSAKTSRPSHIEHAQMFPDCGAKMIGGWGYFLIERGEDSLPYSSANPHNCIDLYLYKEGE